MSSPSWVFKKLSKGVTRSNAVGSQFFTLQSLKDAPLARESGQNSIDSNRDNDEKMILKLKLVERSKDTINETKYLNSLYNHVANPDSGLSVRKPGKNDNFRFLVIEDFNTRGVRGDLLYTDDGEDSNLIRAEQDVYHLFRSLQMTGKNSESNDDLGSWGIGKNMYAQTSDMGCFLGYSIRDDHEAEFLFGMSILQVHNLDGIKYDSTGNFGYGDSSPDQITAPITNQTILTDFKKCFDIERVNEKGLSIVIPCVYKKVTYEMLVKTFLETWMYGILLDRIEIHIKSGDQNIVLSKETISDNLSVFQDHNERKEIEMNIQYSRMSILASNKDFIKLSNKNIDNRPAWKQGDFNTQSLESWQTQLDESDRLYFQIPVKLVYADISKNTIGHFQVYLFKDSNITVSNSVQFIRDVLIIPAVKSRFRLLRGYHAIVRVTGSLANVLRDSEGPAHLEWSKELEKFKDLQLKYGSQLISFVSNSAARLRSFMLNSSRDTYHDVLSELLPFQREAEKKKKKKKKRTPKPPKPSPERQPDICHTGKLVGGFKLSDNPEWGDEDMIGKEYKLQMAYDLSEKGNAFQKYRDWHFKVLDLSVSSKKVDNIRVEKNIIKFDVTGRGWYYSLEGFSEEYQIKLDVKRS